TDLPDFFDPLISGKMALHRKGRADEKEPLQRGADGRDPAGGREDVGRRGGQEEQGQRTDDLRLAPALQRHAAERREAAQGAGDGERQTEEAAGRARSGDRPDARGEPPKVVSPQARREQVAFLNERGLSQRRACGLIGVARSGLVYEHRMPSRDAPALEAMRRLSAQYPRYGYRRIRIFLRREGLPMSVSRCERLWRQAKLQLPARRRRRRVSSSRPRPLAPRAANHVWAYDFVFDACANGQQIKCLTVVDEYTHECLAIDVAGSIRSTRVIETLARLMSLHGTPAYLRSDNGPEFV